VRARLAFLISLLLGVQALACGSQFAEGGGANLSATAREGQPLPAARLTSLDGKPADLTDATRGRVALVSFWATWCEACLREMDALNRLTDRTKDRPDAIVLGVDVGESPSDVEAFVRRRGLLYPQLVDSDYRLADALGQRRVPATIVVDRKGRIVHRGDALDAESLEAFRRALAETR
jgi:peroxiredoxin